MPESNETLIYGANCEEFMESFRKAIVAAASDEREKLDEVRRDSLIRLRREGMFERFNGRTAAEIMADWKPAKRRLITEGQLEGLRFQLFDAPDSQGETGETDGSQ